MIDPTKSVCSPGGAQDVPRMKMLKVRGQEVAADALLAALHNHSSAQGMGAIHDIGRNLTRAEAAKYVERFRNAETGKFAPFTIDWFLGRPIKVFEDANGELRTDLYDRDNGEGAFARALEDALTMP